MICFPRPVAGQIYLHWHLAITPSFLRINKSIGVSSVIGRNTLTPFSINFAQIICLVASPKSVLERSGRSIPVTGFTTFLLGDARFTLDASQSLIKLNMVDLDNPYFATSS